MHGTSAGAPVSLSGYGGLITLATPDSVPEGASPRTYDTDFDVGGVRTRDGLTTQYVVTSTTVGPDSPSLATSDTWASPMNITLLDGSYTSQSPLNVPNQIDVEQYGFNIAGSPVLVGITVTLHGYSDVPQTSILAELIYGGLVYGTAKISTLPTTPGTIVFGGAMDTWGTPFTVANVNALTFGVRIGVGNSSFTAGTAFLDSATISVAINTNGSNFTFIDTITFLDGTVKNLLLDATGNLYTGDLVGNLTLVRTGITTNSYAILSEGPNVNYLAFTNGHYGSDMPLQYTENWIDRITQVGPGAAPTFAPGQATGDTYPIVSINQPPAKSNILNPGHISVLLWSAGPGSTAPGNVLTVYYSPSFYSGSPQPAAQDLTLVNAFNSGQPVYVYISGAPYGNGTFLVTSVGNALPPGVDHFRYYFTVQMATSSYQRQNETPGQYQQTIATMKTSTPVPGLTVGNQVTVAGASVAAWDASWPIAGTLNSAQMVITNTSITASVATYSYAVTSGTPPAAGELVTVTGTTNANGALNVTNATIVSSTGGTSGTFTLSVDIVSASSSPENGSATTAGTIFTIDPGLLTLGTLTNPIYGNSTGGTLTFLAAAQPQIISPGTRQGTVVFITRNGYYTAPAPPVTFTCPENTTTIQVSNIPIGPPNVVSRLIAITEAGQNGVPGANFFAIPTPVEFVVNNVTYTATSTLINDNTTTSVTLSFNDSVLLNALAIDVYGYNLFNQIEIGDPGWVIGYSARNFYGQCWNKVQNFNNMSFDGGYLPSGQLVPLGWSQPDIYGSLINSAKFGMAYYIANNTGATVSGAGFLSQSAYQDAYKVPIIQPNTTYSVRVTARIPSGNHTGTLTMTMTANGAIYAAFSLPFASMTTSHAIYTGPFLTNGFATVPAALTFNFAATGIGAGADVEIDRIEIYPTEMPILTTTVYGSYAGLPEQVDAVTGQVQFISENQQPVNGAMVMYDTLYALKGWAGTAPGSSMYSLQASANLEPAQWEEPEVAQRLGGSIGPLAFDLGEQWFAGMTRPGLYVFVGGQPGKITQEIQQVWDSINWPFAYKSWVLNDEVERRLFVGVPMATPNFWLPNAPVNANPTIPNVILMCNYQGLDTGEALRGEPQMHTTMFGTLNAVDMRRKWSIWQIPSPYGNVIQGAIDQQIAICNGRSNSKVYFLDETTETDDNVIIDSLYTTAGLVEASKRQTTPGVGSYRMRWGYMVATLQSLGNIAVRLLPNRLLGPTDSTSGYATWTLPGGFSPGNPAWNDSEAPLNFAATRTYIEFRENDGHGFSLSNLMLKATKDTWNALRGAK